MMVWVMSPVLNKIMELKASLLHALPGEAMLPPLLLGVFSILFVVLYMRQWITQKKSNYREEGQ
jgi:hypothetical protein